MSERMQHEDLQRLHEVDGGSDRSFGIVFCVIFCIVGCWPLLSGATPYWWAFAVAAPLLGLSFAAPGVLAPANRLWTKFGLLLGRIISPVMLGVVFFLVVTPTALVMRCLRRDLLDLKSDKDKETYWIHREAPDRDSMKNQF